MNTRFLNSRMAQVGFRLSLLSLAMNSVAQAQDGAGSDEDIIAPPVMEEVTIFGRLVSGAESLIAERQEQAVATDYLGAEQIGRIGDSTVALALTRVPGVTLIDDKYVFVRGLGERYSSATLNGAMVPSPDLSRNVLPLDIFPTSIVVHAWKEQPVRPVTSDRKNDLDAIWFAFWQADLLNNRKQTRGKLHWSQWLYDVPMQSKKKRTAPGCQARQPARRCFAGRF